MAERSLNSENSTNRKVLILTDNYDPEANLVGIGLRNRGIDYVRLNIGAIPHEIRIRYSIEKNSDLLKFEFDIQKHLLDVSKISVVWVRNFDIQEINFGDNELASVYSLQQWDNAFQIFQNNIRCEWINTPKAAVQASDRAKQLSIAKAIGFDIPSTLITNDPKAARDFYHFHDGDIVVKALRNHSVGAQGKLYSMYTHRILKQDLSKLDDLVYAPCILQQRLRKKSELRVTVVENQVFAAQLDPQSRTEGYDDDVHRTLSIGFPARALDISDILTGHCVNLVKSLGLRYGAIDFILDKNDRLIFLEVNPTGDWYWIERQVRLPITKAMVDLIEKEHNNSAI